MAGYSEESPRILWVYHSYAYQYLLALVALISRWIQNFRRTAGLTSSAFHDWSIEQSVSVPTFLGQLQTGCKWLRTKYTRIHLSTEWDCFFPENWTDFLFQGLPEDIQSKIVYIYSVINEYSLRSRDVHSTPSWHKWSDFEYRPWCLAIVVRTPPAALLNFGTRAVNLGNSLRHLHDKNKLDLFQCWFRAGTPELGKALLKKWAAGHFYSGSRGLDIRFPPKVTHS